MSPDGQLVAYAAGPLTASRIYVRQVDGGRPIAIAADLAGAQRLPFWSPDGKRLVFRSARGIEIAPALGGPPKTIVPLTGNASLLPGPWSPDGRRIAFARSDSLYVVPVDGGAPRCSPTAATCTRSPGRPMGAGSRSSGATGSRSTPTSAGSSATSARARCGSSRRGPAAASPSASPTIAHFTRARSGCRTAGRCSCSRTPTAGSTSIRSRSSGPARQGDPGGSRRGSTRSR